MHLFARELADVFEKNELKIKQRLCVQASFCIYKAPSGVWEGVGSHEARIRGFTKSIENFLKRKER